MSLQCRRDDLRFLLYNVRALQAAYYTSWLARVLILSPGKVNLKLSCTKATPKEECHPPYFQRSSMALSCKCPIDFTFDGMETELAIAPDSSQW